MARETHETHENKTDWSGVESYLSQLLRCDLFPISVCFVCFAGLHFRFPPESFRPGVGGSFVNRIPKLCPRNTRKDAKRVRS